MHARVGWQLKDNVPATSLATDLSNPSAWQAGAGCIKAGEPGKTKTVKAPFGRPPRVIHSRRRQLRLVKLARPHVELEKPMTEESGVDPGPRRKGVTEGKAPRAPRGTRAYRPEPVAVETAALRAAPRTTAPRLPPVEACKHRADTRHPPRQPTRKQPPFRPRGRSRTQERPPATTAETQNQAQAPAFTRSANAAHVSAAKASTDPSGSMLSRTAIRRASLPTSTHCPPLVPL